MHVVGQVRARISHMLRHRRFTSACTGITARVHAGAWEAKEVDIRIYGLAQLNLDAGCSWS